MSQGVRGGLILHKVDPVVCVNADRVLYLASPDVNDHVMSVEVIVFCFTGAASIKQLLDVLLIRVTKRLKCCIR
jgi:hypothetical protein